MEYYRLDVVQVLVHFLMFSVSHAVCPQANNGFASPCSFSADSPHINLFLHS